MKRYKEESVEEISLELTEKILVTDLVGPESLTKVSGKYPNSFKMNFYDQTTEKLKLTVVFLFPDL